MGKSISLLLGAGFSAPAGYPLGNSLNEILLSCTGDNFAFNTDGRLMISTDGKKPDLGYKTSYDFQFDFCRDLIQYFNSLKGYFDYEEFYDFFVDDAKTDPGVIDFFHHNFYGSEKDLGQILFSNKNIYNQLISFYLKDGNGVAWYEDDAVSMSSFNGYLGVLNCLKEMEEENRINVHTLNHDLFFERLDSSEWFNGKLCDGFEETRSLYYGDLYNSVTNTSQKVAIPYYNDEYKKNICLYKLHGSKDYAIYYRPQGTNLIPETYVKVPSKIGINNLYKKIYDKNGDLKYEHCWINYHADFLTGTTAKIRRYDEPLLFKHLFEHFIHNLVVAEKLIIIGYGGKDNEINKIIMKNFDYRNKPSYIIDPFPGTNLKKLQAQLNAKFIIKNLADIQMVDF
ncbi:MAG: SIR2 family protein [Prolixibacteraceae bacterium]|jgi:hypothetical protein|nr:SIR2 family protein [Prolixibacteraceae bacterium]